MSAVRFLVALLAALAATAAVVGLAVTQSLTDSTDFVSAMDQALTGPAVQQEVQHVIRQEVVAAGDQLAQNAGPLGELARSGSEAVAVRLSETVSSDDFRSAWTEWSQLLYEGLTDNAVGSANEKVVVSGSDITVGIEPLVAPLLGDTVAGGLTGALDLLGRDSDITIVTSLPVQQALRVTGALSQWRWIFLGAAIGLALVATLAGRRRIRWLGITLILTAACTGGLAALLNAAQDTPPPGSQTPQLTLAIMNALTAPWQSALVESALVLVAVGAAALFLSLFLRPSPP